MKRTKGKGINSEVSFQSAIARANKKAIGNESFDRLLGDIVMTTVIIIVVAVLFDIFGSDTGRGRTWLIIGAAILLIAVEFFSWYYIPFMMNRELKQKRSTISIVNVYKIRSVPFLMLFAKPGVKGIYINRVEKYFDHVLFVDKYVMKCRDEAGKRIRIKTVLTEKQYSQLQDCCIKGQKQVKVAYLPKSKVLLSFLAIKENMDFQEKKLFCSLNEIS